jgi:DNA polymerase epsilon subunit 1
MELEGDSYLRRRYEGQIANIQIVEKEDLNLVNNSLISTSAYSEFG